MTDNPISMNQVYSRELCLMDSREMTMQDSYAIKNNARTISESKSSKVLGESVANLCKRCAAKESSNFYIETIVDSLKSLNESTVSGSDRLFDDANSHLINDILPYVKHNNLAKLTEMYESRIDNPEKLAVLQEAVARLKICDRILDNHQKLSKRFDVNEIIKKYSTTDEICRSVCEMVDTYQMSPKAKMMICLEETSYLMSTYGRDYKEEDMLESISDYFLATSDEDPAFFAEAIKESKVISNSADRKIRYLTNPKPEKSKYLNELSLDAILENADDDIADLINRYKMDTQKSDSKFKQLINKIFTKSPQAIIDDTPSILRFVRGFLVASAAAKNLIAGGVLALLNGFIRLNLSRKETKRVIKYFEAERNSVQEKLDRTKDKEKAENLKEYLDALDKSIDKLNEYNSSLYSDNENPNGDEEEENKDDDSKESDTGGEDDDFSFDESFVLELSSDHEVIMNNLLQDSIDADNMITKLAKETLETKKAKKTDIKDDVHSIVSNIHSGGIGSFVIDNFDLTECDDKLEVQEMCQNITNVLNNMYYNRNTYISHIATESYVDFYLNTKFGILTTLTEDEQGERSMPDSMAYRSMVVIETANQIDRLYNYHPETLVDAAIKKVDKLSPERASMFLEAWTYCGEVIDRSDIKKFVNEYATYKHEDGDYLEEYMIKNNFDNLTPQKDVNIKEMVEAVDIMSDVINEAVDLNSLKLTWMGFKNKLKKYGAKASEFSRDLDMSFNNLIRGIQNAKDSNRREAIIKGQVTPSLSKIIKIGIALAGLGVATHSIVVPAITAVGGLAMAKNATRKEKSLILDEIDIELQVVERELNNFENSGNASSKKYRTLLTYQKNLQREKQRIVYGLARQGKPLQVDSKAGFNYNR